MHYVYILQSEQNGRFYVGATNNVIRRLSEHNSGMVKSTAPYTPWELKKTEKYANISQARRREQFIKAKKSRKIIETIIGSKG
jgi:putative endonuclease